MELKNKFVVLTGACGGIGSEIAKLLSKNGCSLLLIDVNEEMLKNLSDSIKGDVKYIVSDFSNRVGLYKLVEDIKGVNIKVDVLINNAGIGVYKSLKDVTLEEFEESFYINVFAPMVLSKELINVMGEFGVILNMGSLSGVRTLPNRIAYNSSKFSLRGFSLSLNEELKDSHISSILLTLGSTFTQFGGVSLEEKAKMKENGKSFFSTDYVANKVVEILSSGEYKSEYVLAPEESVNI